MNLLLDTHILLWLALHDDTMSDQADPFDRMLLAQAFGEGMQLVTTDAKLSAYDGPILEV